MFVEQPFVPAQAIGTTATPTFADIFSSNSALTDGSLTRTVSAELRSVVHKFTWANSNVMGLGAVTTGTIKVCTLPAKCLVLKAFIVITGQAASITALTVSLGRTGAAYVDYLVASSAKAVANTVYGDAVGELGTNLSALIGDLASIVSTTDVNLQFVSALENLNTVTASTGEIYLQTVTLP